MFIKKITVYTLTCNYSADFKKLLSQHANRRDPAPDERKKTNGWSRNVIHIKHDGGVLRK